MPSISADRRDQFSDGSSMESITPFPLRSSVSSRVPHSKKKRWPPGFRERILARHVMNTAQLEAYNANYIGGDINGGAIDIRQLFTRPALRRSPYRTSAKGIYICSSSTPPGGGVHGMCGYHAAQRALKDLFPDIIKQ